MTSLFSRFGHLPAGQTDFFLQAYESVVQRTQSLVIIAATSDQASALTYFLMHHTDCNPLLFPDLELMPYDEGAVSVDIIEERYRCMHTMLHQKNWVVVTSPFAISMKMLPWATLLQSTLSLKVGQSLNRSQWLESLKEQGYYQVSEVKEPLEYALRGEVIDWFPVGQEWPLRLSLPDDILEGLRTFDPQTQKTLTHLEEKTAFPSKEYSLSQEDYTHLVSRFRRDFTDRSSAFYKSLLAGRDPAGLSFFAPLLVSDKQKMISFFSVLKEHNPHLLIHPQAQQEHVLLLEKAQQHWESASITYGFIPYRPDRIYIDLKEYPESTLAQTQIGYKTYQGSESLRFVREALESYSVKILFSVVQGPKIALLQQWMEQHQIAKPKYSESLESFFQAVPGLYWTIAPFEEICQLSECVWIVPYTALVQQRLIIPDLSAQGRQRRRLQKSQSLDWDNVSYVVHEDHGIAKYHGLKKIVIDQVEQEFIELEYAEQGRLYLPVGQINLLTPHLAHPDSPPTLHKLGQSKWEKEKEKAQLIARDHAVELLEIYAKRAQNVAYQHTIPPQYEAFAQEFPFQETIDQEQAIADVLHDLTRSQPMDRLICGDVGFGKTEVALRAGFVSVMNKKQVLLLAPTTLLAQQHYETVVERMSHWGINVALLSRHTTKKATLLAQMASGEKHWIVGTHSLLQEGIAYQDLGLVIVDEEHRFGVRDKERLKKVRHNVHWLSMTATPIPRTLSMSLQGLRDLSLIATPPLARRKIITTIHQNSHELVKHAIERELFRRGQVYYLCNDIGRLQQKVELIKALCPQARVTFVHGQMPHAQMEQQMHLFYQHACDVLVCTTIIETGIDVPRAHTILIEDAHEFGLAQLHQLRGRVGRSHHQAYAYCLVPFPLNRLPGPASARLEAFKNYQDLGSGYQIATHDLEIRGAGELLGEKQSGHVTQLGLAYYQKLLEKAGRNLQQHQHSAPAAPSMKFDLGVQPCLSAHQIPDPVLRMRLYAQWSQLETLEQWKQAQWTFEDRYGQPDLLSQMWQQYHKMRVMALQECFSEWSWIGGGLKVGFYDQAPAKERWIKWLQEGKMQATALSPTTLLIKLSAKDYAQKAYWSEILLNATSSPHGNLEKDWTTRERPK